MYHHGKGNIATQRNKKWYSIYKEYVLCHKYISVELDELLGGYNNISYHMDWFIPNGVTF